MKPVLFVKCDPYETFGVAPSAFSDAGADVVVWESQDASSDRPSLADHSGVVVFGSTFNVEHADEQPFIKDVGNLMAEAVEGSTPLLGVCFGAQVLAWTLGSQVRKAPAREVGFEPVRPAAAAAEDRLVSHYSDGDMVFQWHMDTFDLPEGATPLASGDLVPLQAYRFGDLAWGIQFHFEIDEPEMNLWLDAFAEEADLLETWGKSADQVRSEAGAYMSAHNEKGRETFSRFAEVAGRA